MQRFKSEFKTQIIHNQFPYVSVRFEDETGSFIRVKLGAVSSQLAPKVMKRVREIEWSSGIMADGYEYYDYNESLVIDFIKDTGIVNDDDTSVVDTNTHQKKTHPEYQQESQNTHRFVNHALERKEAVEVLHTTNKPTNSFSKTILMWTIRGLLYSFLLYALQLFVFPKLMTFAGGYIGLIHKGSPNSTTDSLNHIHHSNIFASGQNEGGVDAETVTSAEQDKTKHFDPWAIFHSIFGSSKHIVEPTPQPIQTSQYQSSTPPIGTHNKPAGVDPSTKPLIKGGEKKPIHTVLPISNTQRASKDIKSKS